MLPRTNRLSLRGDFARVYAHGRQYRSSLLAMRVLRRSPEKGGAKPRIGISVSRKVGGSVQRNLVRRRLREACRELSRAPASLDFVLVARPAAAEANFQQITEVVEKLSHQAIQELSHRAPV